MLSVKGVFRPVGNTKPVKFDPRMLHNRTVGGSATKMRNTLGNLDDPESNPLRCTRGHRWVRVDRSMLRGDRAGRLSARSVNRPTSRRVHKVWPADGPWRRSAWMQFCR